MALGEGETGAFAGAGGVEYTGVSSCLTVTCKIAGVPDTYVGGHLSLQVPAGKLDSSQVLPEMRRLIAGREIEAELQPGAAPDRGERAEMGGAGDPPE